MLKYIFNFIFFKILFRKEIFLIICFYLFIYISDFFCLENEDVVKFSSSLMEENSSDLLKVKDEVDHFSYKKKNQILYKYFYYTDINIPDLHKYYSLNYIYFNIINPYGFELKNYFFYKIEFLNKYSYFYFFKYYFFVEVYSNNLIINYYNSQYFKNFFDIFLYLDFKISKPNFSLGINRFSLYEDKYNFIIVNQVSYLEYIKKFIYSKNNTNFVLWGENFYNKGLLDLYFFSIYLFIINYFLILFFFFFFIFIIIYFFFLTFFFYIYLTYKYFIMSRYLKLFFYDENNLDVFDDPGGAYYGFLHYLNEDGDINYNDDYYNLLKYEIFYFDFLIFSNKYIKNWIYFFDSKNFFSFLLGIYSLQFKKFIYLSLNYSKLETVLFPFLNYSDRDEYIVPEWTNLPYENILNAFPEFNFYFDFNTLDYVSSFLLDDTLYDIFLKKFNNYYFFLNPYSTLPVDINDYEYDEVFTNVFYFFKKYEDIDSLLDTFKLRFSFLYFHHKKLLVRLEKNVNFSKTNLSFLEIINSNNDFEIEKFINDFYFEEDDYTVFDLFRFDYDKSVKEYFEIATEREADNYLDDESKDIVRDRLKIYFSYSLEDFHNYENKEINKNFDLFSYINNNYKNYAKYEFLVKNYTWLHFMSNFVVDPLLNIFIRWNRVYVLWFASEEDDEKPVYETDFLSNYLSYFLFEKKLYFNIVFFLKKYISFYDDIYLNVKTLNYSIGFFFSSNKQDFSITPPYKSSLGFIMLNPVLRYVRDYYFFFKKSQTNFVLFSYLLWLNRYSLKKVNINYLTYINLNSFEISSVNTYFFSNLNYPNGMSYSSSLSDESLFSNSFREEFISVESYEEEESNKDMEFVKLDEWFSILSFSLFWTSPLIIYVFSLIINII